jgi:hypothetical protein
MLEMLQRVNWDEYILMMSQGSPPVGLQLVAVNALLVGYWLVQRARRRKSRPGSAWMLQILFVAANIGVVTWGGQLAL